MHFFCAQPKKHIHFSQNPISQYLFIDISPKTQNTLAHILHIQNPCQQATSRPVNYTHHSIKTPKKVRIVVALKSRLAILLTWDREIESHTEQAMPL